MVCIYIYNSMVYVYMSCIVDVVLSEYIGSTWKSADT